MRPETWAKSQQESVGGILPPQTRQQTVKLISTWHAHVKSLDLPAERAVKKRGLAWAAVVQPLGQHRGLLHSLGKDTCACSLCRGMLLDGCCAADRSPLVELPPVAFCNVPGAAQQDAYSRSTYNTQEVRTCPYWNRKGPSWNKKGEHGLIGTSRVKALSDRSC